MCRFDFNKTAQKAEKLNHRVAFPLDLFMDRFMDFNVGDVRRKRQEVAGYRRKLRNLKKELEQYQSYGCRTAPTARAPLLYCLQSVLQYLETPAEPKLFTDMETDCRFENFDKFFCENEVTGGGGYKFGLRATGYNAAIYLLYIGYGYRRHVYLPGLPFPGPGRPKRKSWRKLF